MAKIIKYCNSCGVPLRTRNKVPNRNICVRCFKVDKAEYDSKRDRTIPPKEYIKDCKLCRDSFTTTKHDRLYCSDRCRDSYKNMVKRARRKVK